MAATAHITAMATETGTGATETAIAAGTEITAETMAETGATTLHHPEAVVVLALETTHIFLPIRVVAAATNQLGTVHATTAGGMTMTPAGTVTKVAVEDPATAGAGLQCGTGIGIAIGTDTADRPW